MLSPAAHFDAVAAARLRYTRLACALSPTSLLKTWEIRMLLRQPGSSSKTIQMLPFNSWSTLGNMIPESCSRERAISKATTTMRSCQQTAPWRTTPDPTRRYTGRSPETLRRHWTHHLLPTRARWAVEMALIDCG